MARAAELAEVGDAGRAMGAFTGFMREGERDRRKTMTMTITTRISTSVNPVLRRGDGWWS